MRALAFRPQPGDVITLTTPKTGQTWLIAQLRNLSLGVAATDDSLATKLTAEGDGVPWLEHFSSGLAADKPQPGKFRIFKSHLTLAEMRAIVEAYPEARFVPWHVTNRAACCWHVCATHSPPTEYP